MIPKTLILLLVCGVLFLIRWTSALAVDAGHFKKDRTPKRCSYTKKYRMLVADCYGLDLNAVPPSLRNDIEILDATFNRIRDLHKDSFQPYTYLKILYLEDNMISYIEDGTFDNLENLEVIDLSTNSLDTIPSGVLQLPRLRKLYVNNNRLNTANSGGFIGAPISETLEFLSMANCHLQMLPILDMYPNMLELNVSGNDLKRISPEQLAPMCQLKTLDLRENRALFKDTSDSGDCDCHMLETWISDKKIAMAQDSKLNCTAKIHGNELKDITPCGNFTEAEEMYNICMSSVISKAEVIQTRKTWVIVAVTLSVIIGVVLLVLFYLHRRNKRKNKNRSKMNNINSSNNSNNNNDGKDVSETEEEVTTNQLLEKNET